MAPRQRNSLGVLKEQRKSNHMKKVILGNEATKINSFKKRFPTLVNKAQQLQTLCGVSVGMICFGNDGKCLVFPNEETELRGFVQSYQQLSQKEKNEINLMGYLEGQKRKHVDKKLDEKFLELSKWLNGLSEAEALNYLERKLICYKEKLKSLTSQHDGSTSGTTNEVGLLEFEEQGTANAVGFSSFEEQGTANAVGFSSFEEQGTANAVGFSSFEEQGTANAVGFSSFEEQGTANAVGLLGLEEHGTTNVVGLSGFEEHGTTNAVGLLGFKDRGTTNVVGLSGFEDECTTNVVGLLGFEDEGTTNDVGLLSFEEQNWGCYYNASSENNSNNSFKIGENNNNNADFNSGGGLGSVQFFPETSNIVGNFFASDHSSATNSQQERNNVMFYDYRTNSSSMAMQELGHVEGFEDVWCLW